MVKRYGARLRSTACRRASAPASVTALLGPNGAGKTTTVEICEGYRTADAGSVRVLGLDPARDGRRLRPRVGVMLQSGGVYPSVRAGEMLRHVATLHADPLGPRRPGRAARPRRGQPDAVPPALRRTAAAGRWRWRWSAGRAWSSSTSRPRARPAGPAGDLGAGGRPAPRRGLGGPDHALHGRGRARRPRRRRGPRPGGRAGSPPS